MVDAWMIGGPLNNRLIEIELEVVERRLNLMVWVKWNQAAPYFAVAPLSTGIPVFQNLWIPGYLPVQTFVDRKFAC
jgi:hypothetical protein